MGGGKGNNKVEWPWSGVQVVVVVLRGVWMWILVTLLLYMNNASMPQYLDAQRVC